MKDQTKGISQVQARMSGQTEISQRWKTEALCKVRIGKTICWSEYSEAI